MFTFVSYNFHIITDDCAGKQCMVDGDCRINRGTLRCECLNGLIFDGANENCMGKFTFNHRSES